VVSLLQIFLLKFWVCSSSNPCVLHAPFNSSSLIWSSVRSANYEAPHYATCPPSCTAQHPVLTHPPARRSTLSSHTLHTELVHMWNFVTHWESEQSPQKNTRWPSRVGRQAPQGQSRSSRCPGDLTWGDRNPGVPNPARLSPGRGNKPCGRSPKMRQAEGG
jgi:hypothetical protein